jgi:hypothetical protein
MEHMLLNNLLNEWNEISLCEPLVSMALIYKTCSVNLNEQLVLIHRDLLFTFVIVYLILKVV